MALLPLIIAPDPLLKQVSAPVAQVDDSVRALFDDMLETMYRSHGIGLAAVQVGVLKRLIVVDVSWRDDEETAIRKPLKLVNAEILWDSEDEAPYNEGCLSFPDQFSEVVRPKEIRVAYLDEYGNKCELEARGLLATCIQHEIDHTNGVTFVDHISRVKREMILNKLRKAKRLGEFDPLPVHEHVHTEGCRH